MRIVIEDVEGSIYLDLILDKDECETLIEGRLLEGMTTLRPKRFYIGVRCGESWRHNDNFFKDMPEGEVE